MLVNAEAVAYGSLRIAYAAQWPQEASHLVFIESSLPSFGQEEAMDVSNGGR
jgi:hypothetical protein